MVGVNFSYRFLSYRRCTLEMGSDALKHGDGQTDGFEHSRLRTGERLGTLHGIILFLPTWELPTVFFIRIINFKSDPGGAIQSDLGSVLGCVGGRYSPTYPPWSARIL